MMREDDKERADSVADLINWLFCQPNPIPLNTALAMCGLVQPVSESNLLLREREHYFKVPTFLCGNTLAT